jgi:hypothetical protein
MTNNNWMRSISKSYSHLDEARKMKPTSTDRVQNRKIKNAARSAHQIAANAISSIPSAVPHPEYSGGVHGYDDPVHASIMDHLGDVAPGVTDPEQAIRLVAKKHGVDPKAAIAALSTSAPMSPRETVNRMAGLKVENINNNMKNNNKSWIRQLSESYIRKTLNESNDAHERIKGFFDRHELSRRGILDAKEIGNILDQTGPHETADSAVDAIYPHALLYNDELHYHANKDRDEDDQLAPEQVAERFGNGIQNDLADMLRRGTDYGDESGRIPSTPF